MYPRDSQDTRADLDHCPDCGAHYTEPCEDGCQCDSCRLRDLDVVPEDAGVLVKKG